MGAFYICAWHQSIFRFFYTVGADIAELAPVPYPDQEPFVFAFVPSIFNFCQYCGYRSRKAIILGRFISVP